MMTYAYEMHGKWLEDGTDQKKLQFYHPMIACFTQFVAWLRGRESIVRNTARISLPLEVETRFEYHLLKFI